MKFISSKLTSLVSLEQFQLKPIGRYGGGLLKLALWGKWGSSLPLEQRANTPWKIIGPTLVPLKIFDFHFISKVDKLDYFGGRSRRVYQIFYFSVFYANLKKIIFWISIKGGKIRKLINPSATTSKIVQFMILSWATRFVVTYTRGDAVLRLKILSSQAKEPI